MFQNNITTLFVETDNQKWNKLCKNENSKNSFYMLRALQSNFSFWVFVDIPASHLLGKGFAWRIHEPMPFGGICKKIGQDVPQKGECQLLHVQTENRVQQLHGPHCMLFPCLLQQLLRDEAEERGGTIRRICSFFMTVEAQ